MASTNNQSTGLHSPGLLAKRPAIGLSMFLIGGLIFGSLVYNLRSEGPLIDWDTMLASTFPAIGLQSPAFVIAIMNAGFYLGKEFIIALAILLNIYFFQKRNWQKMAMMTIGAAGSGLLFTILITLFDRQRPPDQIGIIINQAGFPSGHAIAVVTFYGLLAYWLIQKTSSVFWKVIVAALAFLMIGFVGFSRIFTGGHYLTDILAGYAVGIAWSGLIYTLIEIYFQKRKLRNIKR